MVVLKPVVWNDNGYTWPSGNIAGSGFTKDYGYGHEEWNGRSDWVWDGWKVFHTESKGKMVNYAAEGKLGIIMTAMRAGQFYAVGVAAAVVQNNTIDAKRISKSLRLDAYPPRMWKVQSIRKAMESRENLTKHWKSHTHINWRCPKTHFVWFDEPIKIQPDAVIPSDPPRQAIAKMHGAFQIIRPDQALAILEPSLEKSHSIVDWLSTDDFDPVPKNARLAPPPKGKQRNSASTPKNPYTRYLEERELVITPMHDKLQRDFRRWLKASGRTEIAENRERVDLRYRDMDRGLVFAEVKPTDAASCRFAIRTAIGQLLDYSQLSEKDPDLLIVVDEKPKEQDQQLALQNDFGIAWRSANAFEVEWP